MFLFYSLILFKIICKEQKLKKKLKRRCQTGTVLFETNHTISTFDNNFNCR